MEEQQVILADQRLDSHVLGFQPLAERSIAHLSEVNTLQAPTPLVMMPMISKQ